MCIRDRNIPKALQQRYNHDEVKSALKEETSNKCMYCESKIAHITYEHIEHIKPKSIYPNLTFVWSNLGLTCPKCNMNKSSKYDEECPFINPYIDEPSEYFVALGPFIYHKPGRKRGEITEKTIDLNRAELLEQRIERIDSIRFLFDKYANEENVRLKDILFSELQKEIEDNKPYSFCAKSTFRQLLPPAPN